MKKSKLTVDSCGGKYFGKINMVSALDYMHPHEETEKPMLQCKSLEESIWTNHVFKTKKRNYKKKQTNIIVYLLFKRFQLFILFRNRLHVLFMFALKFQQPLIKSCKPLKDISKFGSVLYMYICMRPQNINLSNSKGWWRKPSFLNY